MKDLIITLQLISIIALLVCCFFNQKTIGMYRETCHNWSVAYKDMEQTKDFYEEAYQDLYGACWEDLVKKEKLKSKENGGAM